jgi:hypothetical protein
MPMPLSLTAKTKMRVALSVFVPADIFTTYFGGEFMALLSRFT